mmetsp:Transcript_9986/g.13111  ORF Transcript_9986/g.13111 Transcript_9986/m.13111 type:complete len:839 (-) Transcript_9986:81-2597(-)
MRKVNMVDRPRSSSARIQRDNDSQRRSQKNGENDSRGRVRLESADSIGSKISRSPFKGSDRSRVATRGISRTSSQSSIRSRSVSPRPNNRPIRHSTMTSRRLGRVSHDEEMSIEISSWLLSLRLTKTIKNLKHDFSNGAVMAEIFHKCFGSNGPAAVTGTKLKRHLPPLNSFNVQLCGKQSKIANWNILVLAAKKFGVVDFASEDEVEGIVMGKSGAALTVLTRFYEQFYSKSPPTSLASDINESIQDQSSSSNTTVADETLSAPSSKTNTPKRLRSQAGRAGRASRSRDLDGMGVPVSGSYALAILGTSMDDTSFSTVTREDRHSKVDTLVEDEGEEKAALRWAEEEAARALTTEAVPEEEDNRRRVVFANKGGSGIDDEGMQRRSMLGELTGSVGRGGSSSLRRTSNNEHREKLREAQEKAARQSRELGWEEEQERKTMEQELRSLLDVLLHGSGVSGSRIATSKDVHKKEMLGRGRFACVFAGSWTSSPDAPPVAVAVKEFMFGVSRKTAPLPVQRIFHHEARTLATLAHHPKVMDLVAVVMVPRPMILLELIEVGSLFDVMHGDSLRSWQEAPLREKLGICVDVSEGLTHLHASGLLHGDLKSHNVLVGLRSKTTQHPGVGHLQAKLKRQLEGWRETESELPPREDGLVWVAKLGDLGTVALVPSEGEAPLVAEVGTAGWMAPEVCWSAPAASGGQARGGYGLSADVWSFGVVLWECFGDHHRLDPFKPGNGLWRGGSNPYAGMAAEEYLRRLQDGERWPLTLTDDDEEILIDSFQSGPSVFEAPSGFDNKGPQSYVRALQEVACSCWHLEPPTRPPVNTIAERLHILADSLIR